MRNDPAERTHPFAAWDRRSSLRAPSWLVNRACSRLVGPPRSLDVCLDSKGPFIEAVRSFDDASAGSRGALLYAGFDCSTQSFTIVVIDGAGSKREVVCRDSLNFDTETKKSTTFSNSQR